MKKWFATCLVIWWIGFLIVCPSAAENLTAPSLTNNPRLDVIVTNKRPLLTFYNASGGTGQRTYIIQIDKSPTFDSSSLVEYNNVPETNEVITSKRIDKQDALQDKTKYYWRVRAVDEAGDQGPWAKSRFTLDTTSDDAFMNLVRIPIKKVEVSSGEVPEYIIDITDHGQATFWRAAPPGDPVQWVRLDLGKVKQIKRIWMLSNPHKPDGWLKNFVWQMSKDGKSWQDIPGTKFKNNDTYRNIIDIKPVAARYLKLVINQWYGYAPQVNLITLYSPGKPRVPDAPSKDYVLLVGNQKNGRCFTGLEDFVKSLDLNLTTLTIPHFKVSMEMLQKLDKKPVAIILSGSNSGYHDLPMFEYNGEFEIIRQSKVPILGICCGHQLTVMAYGYTFVRDMGWHDITSLNLQAFKSINPITIKKKDTIFEGIPNDFMAAEVHGWEVAQLPEDYEIIAFSNYVEALRSKSRMLYGAQFHPEINVSYNQSAPYLENFLLKALKLCRVQKKSKK